MNSNRALIVSIAIVVAIIATAVFIFSRTELRSDDSSHAANGERESSDAAAAVSSAAAPAHLSTPAPELTTKLQAPPAPAKLIVVTLDEATHAQLNEMGTIARKAFMSDDEKARRRQLFNDEKFLRDIASLLKSAGLDQTTKREQYQAIDFLLDARTNGNSSVAGELLKSVVSDSQVEDPSVPQNVRENLAGIKAEVLYQWSSREPSTTNDLAGLLPGPVSQKIWANVLDTQKNNAAESATLKK